MSFEMPVGGVPLLECICWDHDRFGKDYLGEFDIALEDIFSEGQVNQEVGGQYELDWHITLHPDHHRLTEIHTATMVYSQVQADHDTTISKEKKEEG